MKCSLYKILFFGLMPLILYGQTLTMISSTDSGCDILYQPGPVVVDTLMSGGTTFHRLSFVGTSCTSEPGSPVLPVRVLVIGIPLQAEIQAHVSVSKSSRLSEVTLLPGPEYVEVEGALKEVHFKGNAYQADQPLPHSLISVEEPAFLGNQRIVRIAVFPARFHPGKGEAEIYESMNIHVTFTGGLSKKAWQPDRNESFLKSSLLNYKQAQSWRRPQQASIKKTQQLQRGQWLQIPVSQANEGMYQVTGQFLQDNQIDLSAIDPATLKVYNNGGRYLPENIDSPRPDGWIENPIVVSDGNDGSFDVADYVLFYGRGAKGWAFDEEAGQFNHYINIFTQQNIYFLVFNDDVPGKRMETIPYQSSGARLLTTFRDHQFIEEDLVHPFVGGNHWVGHAFMNLTPNRTYSLTIQDGVDGDSLFVDYNLWSETSGATHRFTLGYGDEEQSGLALNRRFHLIEAGFVYRKSHSAELAVSYQGSNDECMAYTDWIEIEYNRQLKAHGNSLKVYSPVQPGVYTYQLAGFAARPTVFDVSDGAAIRMLEVESEGVDYRFTDTIAEIGHQYLIITPSVYAVPESIAENPISSLRSTANGADMLILCPEKFMDAAEKLKTHRESADGFKVYLADIQDVYDEFNCGMKDPTAIRDFVKYAYESWNLRPAYLLLMGDGDYDYRNLLPYGDRDWIPPFERNGMSVFSSRSVDDWFTYVETGEAPNNLAVGRLPVGSAEEADAMVEKIIQYETSPDYGDWRQLITMVGDDEYHDTQSQNETNHTRAAEKIAQTIIPSGFHFNKIYLSEYPEVPVVMGRRKPQAQRDLIDQINDGTLLVNYIGHGNHLVWSDERIFNVQTDLEQLENSRMPLVYAATCAWGWYDNPEEQSFAEQMLLAEGRGAIATIAACRFCSAPANEALNEEFMRFLFSEEKPTMRLGEALRLGKIYAYSVSNNEMYHLLGDPAMRLGAPRYEAAITQLSPDSLKALSVIQVQGQVQKDGVQWTDFNGRVGVKSYDSEKEIVYNALGGGVLSYSLAGNSLYRGEAEVENGEFELSFIVPKDISYGGRKGKINLYFWNEMFDGMGYKDSLYVGGSVDLLDQEGPEIQIGFSENQTFVSGDMVESGSDLIAVIADAKSGVNITGEIGHKLVLTLDNAEEDVTPRFNYDEGSYLQGKLHYTLSDLTEGYHTLTLKAWDNANNSSVQTVTFKMVSRDELHLSDVMNYPNPMDESTQTDFTFNINADADIEIRIFTVSGRRIRKIDGYWAVPGYNQIHWDGRDEQGDALANGVYLYKIKAVSDVNGKRISKSKIGRLMMMR